MKKPDAQQRVLRHLFFKKGEEGFTLIELLVVVIIAGVLAAIGIPAWQGMRLKTQAAGAKAVIANIKKECESNRDLDVEEVFTPMTPNGYSVQPQGSLSCYGDSGTGLVSAVPNEVDKNPTYFYEHLTGLISESNINSKPKKKEFEEFAPTEAEWASCSDYSDLRNAFDNNPETIWGCRRHGDIKIDLGSYRTIDTINIYNPGYHDPKGYYNPSTKANYIKLYVDNKLVAEGVQQAGIRDQWDIDDVEGRYITYKTYRKPHHLECLDPNGSCPGGTQANVNRYAELGDLTINGVRQESFQGQPEYDYKHIYKKGCSANWKRGVNYSPWEMTNHTPYCELLTD